MPECGEITLTQNEIKTAINEYMQKYHLYPDWVESFDFMLLHWGYYQRQELSSLTIKFIAKSKQSES